MGSSTPEGNVGLWDVTEASLAYSVPSGAPPNPVYALAFAGDRLAAVYQSQINLFEARSGESLGTLGVAGLASGSWLLSMTSSPDGGRLASGDFSGNLQLWRASDGVLERSLAAHQGQAFALAFTPNGTLATAGADWLVKLWNPETGDLLRTFEQHTDWVSCVAFAEEGDLLASGSFDDTVVLWNTTDASIRRVIDVNDSVVDCVLTPDGTLVVLVGNAVVLYRSDDGGGPLALPFDDIARSIAVAPDGETVVVGGWTGKVELFCRD